MFEIKKRQNNKFELIVNGVIAEDAVVTFHKHRNKESFDIDTGNYQISKSIVHHKIKEFYQAKIETIRLKEWCDWTHFESHVFITDLNHILPKYGISFTFTYSLEDWKRQYSFNEYILELKKIFDSENNYGGKLFLYARDEGDWFEIEFDIGDKESNLFEEIEPYENFLRDCHEKIVQKLTDTEKLSSITTIFQFPESLKVSCEQYLLYFAQFLKDLGINASSNLKEEVGKVLFSVTPTDEIIALDKIREALAIYLNLPSSPILYDESFATMRMQQQVDNLQHAQRMIARELQLSENLLIAQSATLHDKNIIISQQQSIIEQRNKIIEKISSKSIMMDSVENKEELEEIYDGFKIGESKFLKEHIGIHLNPAKVIKTAVKNILGKEDERKSILGLDEETVKDDN